MNTPTPNNAAALLAELDAKGVQIEADGDRLLYRPREAVTVDMAGRMKAHKAHLLVLLATTKTAGWLHEVAATWPAGWRKLWLDRAAIAERDENMPRPVAEDRAFHLLLSAVLAKQGIEYTPGSIPTATLLGRK
jgi:TubC N-terminal docking domain